MFSIQHCTVDAAQLIYSCDWTYTNADGAVSGTHKLTPPTEGDATILLEDVTEETLLGWLNDQLPNTPEEFDVQIAREKEAKSKEEELTVLSFGEAAEEEPVEEV
jgi:hypothetical protein